MFRCLLLLCFLVTTQSMWVPQWVLNGAVRALGFPTTDKCGFTRADGLKCIKEYIDLNHDGEIDEKEFEYAKHHYTPTRMQKIEWAVEKLGWDYTLDKIRPNCGEKKTGKFTPKAWIQRKKTCLPGKADLCKLEYVCKLAKRRRARMKLNKKKNGPRVHV